MHEPIWFSDKLDYRHRAQTKDFLQKIVNRLMQGHARYGHPKKSKQFLSRLKLELKAYEKTGNVENLYNVAVYSFLETQAPENPKFHFDPTVDSVTRGVLGGAS